METRRSFFYIHGSVHRGSILVRCNECNTMQAFIYCRIILHVSGVHRTHHQEYIKLQLQLLVQAIVSEQKHSASVAY